jgi:hypothetical protein
VKPVDLALIAGALGAGKQFSEAAAVELVGHAWTLLGLAAEKLRSLPSQPGGFPEELPGIAMSGAEFLRTYLHGKGSRRAERQQEFIRSLRERGIVSLEPSTRHCEGVLKAFGTLRLTGPQQRRLRELVEELKRSPETARTTARRRKVGGLQTSRKRLIAELKKRGGTANLDVLVASTGFKKGTIEEVVRKWPKSFEDRDVGPLRNISIRIS